ncbi:MAG: DNA mismatch repair protein MutS [Thermomicrobiales bacterium]
MPPYTASMSRPATPRAAKAPAPPPADADDAAAGPLVPSRRQYLDLKAQHPGAILLYRLGDFYETFDEDAQTLARDARVALTSRSFGRSGRSPMAGIPHHALNHYLNRLLAAGHTVAIAEQMTPPGKGLVERAVTRVLSPGTVSDPALLPAGESRYLAALHHHGGAWGLAWVDVSTGEFAVAEFSGDDAGTQLAEEVARLNPAETLIPDDAPDPDRAFLPGHITRLETWRWEPGRGQDLLCSQFRVHSLAGFGCAAMPAAIGAAGATLAYLERTNPALLTLLTGVRVEQPGRWVGLDAATRRNLELTRSLGTGGTRGSLLGVLDLTRTAMGARALRRLVTQPLQDLPEITRRQGVIGALVAAPAVRAAARDALGGIGDLERLVGRVADRSASAREFLSLTAALQRLPDLAETLAPAGLAPSIPDECADLAVMLEDAVGEDGNGGAVIRPGFAPDLDAAHAAVRETREWLANLEARERERTGIRSLKVGFNKVFGYYIEITRANLALAPPEYTRKQTIANGERYVTIPLKEAEARVLAADEEIAARERAALQRLSALIAAEAGRLSATARALAELDALLSLAEVAARHSWVAPVVDDGDELRITGGRHPVVEAHLGGEPFIPNDCVLGGDGARQAVVTGPNMGGKSTFLRQVAVIALLAQIGSFVPAAAARVGVVDRIFTRVGAQDDLARGHSTFMAEMVETAAILHQATARSLLILDEVGRGTSTDDGLAIARATLEDISQRIGARALFATHYLELTGISAELPAITNLHVAALERDGRVVFLYAVQPGAADRAYGVQVARLAGLPPWVADRAELLLQAAVASAAPSLPPMPSEPFTSAATREIVLREDPAPWGSSSPPPAAPSPADTLAAALLALSLDDITAREALQWLWVQRDALVSTSPDIPTSDLASGSASDHNPVY